MNESDIPTPIETLRRYTLEKIAELASCSVETVRRRVRRGQLPAVRHGKGWTVGHADAVKFLTTGGSR
ncbi:MAG: helix-turn-helix domain-containing protein [Verrucomicrobiae bacterium]|nr:helix-turn-helix domain-containing protein [Verrucomicrobiae bacterium]